MHQQINGYAQDAGAGQSVGGLSGLSTAGKALNQLPQPDTIATRLQRLVADLAQNNGTLGRFGDRVFGAPPRETAANSANPAGHEPSLSDIVDQLTAQIGENSRHVSRLGQIA